MDWLTKHLCPRRLAFVRCVWGPQLGNFAAFGETPSSPLTAPCDLKWLHLTMTRYSLKTLGLLLLTSCLWGGLRADEQAEKKPAELADKNTRTKHKTVIAGQEIGFTATTGRLVMKTDAGEPQAEIFYVAYTRDGQDTEKRPVTFCFNGGPGSSSVWLHLGMLGPKIVRFPEDGTPLRPPYHLDDNPYSLLDITDLVFIDPVSTGYSRPAKDVSKQEFHGYREDLRSVGQFIHAYTTLNERWPSPKYLLGESYGGLRAAGLTGYLQDEYNMELNGVVVISGAINFQTLRFSTSNDLPFVTFLPTYAATAWYHNRLSDELQQLPVADVVAQAEAFAYERYAPALLRGTSLSAAAESEIAEEYGRLTGLSPDYVKSANLRVSMSRFGKQLLRDKAQTIGRFDGRYKGADRDSAGERYEFDASGAAIFGPFTACLNDYVRGTLKYKDRRVYEILTGKVQPWSYEQFEGRYVDASETLRRAMTANPYLKMFVACGYYDLATPHFAMKYTLDHLGLGDSQRDNVTVRHYEGGHMMYIHEPSLKLLRDDLEMFYLQASPE